MAGKVIFHIDLNSFFASAEVLKNSALIGQPVVVAGLNRRSVVSTASYEARSYGVHSAMPLMIAQEKCPHLVVVEGDYSWYEELSEKFIRFIRTFSPYVEQASIDECYVDVSEQIKAYKRPLDLAWTMQQRIKDELGLPCSIGVGPNKFLAKMASDMRKPMGITVLRKQEVPRKLWPLSICDMWGIGKKSQPLLMKHGIHTIGDLADPKNERKVTTLLGKHAYHTIQNARGNDTNQLTFTSSVQSISQGTTLDCDIQEYDEVKAVLRRLAKSLSHRAKRDDIKGSLISISIRYHDFTNAVRSTNIANYTNDEIELLEHSLLLFDRNQNGKAIRHLGIALGSLYSKSTSINQLQMPLDGKKQMQSQSQSIQHVLNQLNKQIPGVELTTANYATPKKRKMSND